MVTFSRTAVALPVQLSSRHVPAQSPSRPSPRVGIRAGRSLDYYSGVPGRAVSGWPQPAGPEPRSRVPAWLLPDWSVQLTLILSPGWYWVSTVRICDDEVMVCPASEVIVSPSEMPVMVTAEPG